MDLPHCVYRHENSSLYGVSAGRDSEVVLTIQDSGVQCFNVDRRVSPHLVPTNITPRLCLAGLADRKASSAALSVLSIICVVLDAWPTSKIVCKRFAVHDLINLETSCTFAGE